MNALTEYCVYLLSRNLPLGQIKDKLLKRFKVGLNTEQLVQTQKDYKTEIEILAEDLPRQLKLAQKYGELSLINPLNRLELLQAASIDIARGEERIDRNGDKLRIKSSTAVVAMDKLLRSIREEVAAVENSTNTLDSLTVSVELNNFSKEELEIPQRLEFEEDVDDKL